MTLRQRFANTGQVLFRFRSFLPPLMLLGLTCLLWETVPRDTSDSAYLWRAAAGAVILAGVALRWVTVGRIPRGTSGRNTKRQKAVSLNNTGIYSVVRNPLYVANGLVWAGVTLFLQDLLLTAMFSLGVLLYYVLVVFAEEEYLTERFGEEYAQYACRTPALIPRLRGWRPSGRPFSWRMVVRREHDSLFGTLTGIVLLYHLMDFRSHFGRFMLRREWILPWLVMTFAWLALKAIKKRTRLLHIPRDEDTSGRASGKAHTKLALASRPGSSAV